MNLKTSSENLQNVISNRIEFSAPIMEIQSKSVCIKIISTLFCGIEVSLNENLIRKSCFYHILDKIQQTTNCLYFFLFSPEKNRIRHSVQTVSIGDSLHEMPSPVFWEK